MLERLRAGELRGEQAREVQRHVDGCEACTAQLAQLALGFNAWPEADPVRMLAAIRRGIEERPQGLAGRWRARWRAALAPLAVAAVAGIGFLVLQTNGPADGPRNRVKGGPTLHVFRQKGGVAVEALSGERFTPGEPLQLTVDLPADSLVRIIGIEAGGRLYPIWPSEGDPPFARMKAGSGQRIPGALTPDETPGPETFHVIACTPGSAPPSCRSQGAKGPPACSAGCLTSPFVLQKGR
jgi:hypothetical protein